MKILIDTPIWSKFVRKRNYDKNREIIEKLTEIILNKQEVIIGPVRQELLSGMSNNENFLKLKQKMEAFKNEPIEDSDYERAADFSNICRQHGIQGSATDFLECAVSVRKNYKIFTEDNDFILYKQHLPIQLFEN